MVQQYAEFERKQLEILNQQQRMDLESIHCPRCGSQWFEEVSFFKFKANHNVILGQTVPPKPGGVPYFLLRCVCCSDLLEPHILHNTRDLGGNDYDHFLDTLEGKHDTRKEKEEKEDEVATLRLLVQGLNERIKLLEEKKADKLDKKGAYPKKRGKKLEIPSKEL